MPSHVEEEAVGALAKAKGADWGRRRRGACESSERGIASAGRERRRPPERLTGTVKPRALPYRLRTTGTAREPRARRCGG